MCFSTSASFAAAGLTTLAGAAALRESRTAGARLLAGVPLLFAVHQFAEGVLWLALAEPARASWGEAAMDVYLIVSKVVWPVWVPLAILLLETDQRRRRSLAVLLVVGLLLAPALAYGLAAYPVTANIAGHHVQYRQGSPPLFRWITDLAYPLAVVVPPLIASSRLTRLVGMLLVASLVLTKIFYFYYFASVWCFFAAIISVLVVLIVQAAPHARPRAAATLPPATA
jgi:hypothetical protein